MAYLTMSRRKLQENYKFLFKKFQEKNVAWGVVSKLLCGNKLFLQELIDLGVTEIHDSRISNLAKIKKLDPAIQTVYIKPVSKKNIPSMVASANVSLNSEMKTIFWISEEAFRQNKIHKIIIMVETGDLREGVMGEQLIELYTQVFELPNIEIIGLGTNLNCLNGVMPSTDKLIQLALYKEILELKFNVKIPWISAGTSVTIPLLFNFQLPLAINHFRVGETLFFGVDLFEDSIIEGMHSDVFELNAEIIEMQEKPLLPVGNLAANPQGVTSEIDPSLFGLTSFRAIIDIGLLDVDPKYLVPEDRSLEILGASSDMLVINLWSNPNKYKVGDTLRFGLKYMGALGILNSSYVDKKVIN